MTDQAAGSRGAGSPASSGPLDEYRAKRSPSGTGEPFGGRAGDEGLGGEAGGRRIFVVQKHSATALHWDVRLEMDGVLASWAVPKGPSPNQADKRLAVHVEDHPLEYASFEGVIPKGNYGAGAMIVWDRGTWIPVEDPNEGMKKGKLLFDLRGYKLRGRWTLVQTKAGGGRHWLLIKERDAYEDPNGSTADYADDSVLSGLTVEELGKGGDFGAALRERCAGLGAAKSPLRAADVKVMTAESSDEPFSREGWVFEIKYDGYRLLAESSGGAASLVSRNGNDLTATFPEVARALRGLPYRALVMDGEVVVADDTGIPRFELIQKRGRIVRQAAAERAALRLPATYWAFDLLAFEGHDLRGLPLLKRKELLQAVLPTVGPLRYSDHVAEWGEEMFRRVADLGLEGVVGKRADSAYEAGRSRSWLKVRQVRSGDFAVHGFTEPKRGSAGFGALHLAVCADDGFVYSGRVGTGFSEALLKELGDRLRAMPEAGPPKGEEAPDTERDRWVEPRLVAEVEFKEVTASGLLRQPAFVRLRDDKSPEECVADEWSRALPEPAPPAAPAGAERVVHFSNLDKPFWPDDGYAKGDLVEYYRAVSPWLLPHLADRPLVLTRYPDGIDGKSFFQKNAPDHAPEWIRRVRVYSEGSKRELDYFVAEDLESLLWVANSASIPLHVWQSRTADLGRPDYCVLDLDPKDAPFADVVRIARFLKQTCDEIGLPAFVKTSGSTGLHVMVPLGRQVTYEQSRRLGNILALAAVRELPDAATVARRPEQRDGKVYVDFVQNGHGRLVVAPYCARPLPGAPVSTPLEWDELHATMSMAEHNIKSVPERMIRRGTDPLDGLLSAKPDLGRSLEALQALL